MDSYGSSSLFPRYVDSVIRGFGRGEEPSGANVLRLIQNPLERSLEKITPASQDNFAAAPTAESQSNKRSQCLFARLPRTLSHNASGQSKLHNEPLRSPV